MHIRGAWAWALVIVLFLSLGFNFFLGGFLFERARSGWAMGPPGAARVLDDFPPGVRRMIGRELWMERQQFRATLEEIREKRRQIAAAMREPQLDTDRVKRLLAEVRGLTGQMQERAQDAMLSALSQMSPEERAAIGRHHGRGWGPPWREREGEDRR